MRHNRFLAGGQLNRNRRTLACLAIDLDGAAVATGHVHSDSQVQAGAVGAARGINPIEAVKDIGKVVRRNTDAGISNGDLNETVVPRPGRYPNGALLVDYRPVSFIVSDEDDAA